MNSTAIAAISVGEVLIQITRWPDGTFGVAAALNDDGGALIAMRASLHSALAAGLDWVRKNVPDQRATSEGATVARLAEDDQIGTLDLVLWHGYRDGYEALLTSPDGDRVLSLSRGEDRARVERHGRSVLAGMLATQAKRRAAVAAGTVVELRPGKPHRPSNGGSAA